MSVMRVLALVLDWAIWLALWIVAVWCVIVIAGCAAPGVPAPDPLPTCADLGCPSVTASDKRCSARGECSCTIDRVSTACAAPCADLPCDDVACDGDTCTCAIGDAAASCAP